MNFQRRKWTVPATVNIEKSASSEREKLLEIRIREIEDKFAKFQEQMTQKSKGKGRGKCTLTKSVSEQIDQEARKRLRSFLESEDLASSSSHSFPKPSAPAYEDSATDFDDPGPSFSTKDVSNDDEKQVFIRRIEVLLNGSPIDQIEDKQTEDECLQAYWRMFAFNGQMNSLFTNGIRKLVLILYHLEKLVILIHIVLSTYIYCFTKITIFLFEILFVNLLATKIFGKKFIFHV